VARHHDMVISLIIERFYESGNCCVIPDGAECLGSFFTHRWSLIIQEDVG
jgi:hypothetical protein